MDTRFNCPHCDQHLSVEERGEGMIVNCPSCQQQIEIPHAAAPQVNVPTQLGGVAPAKMKISIAFVATVAVVVCALALATMYFRAAEQRSNRAEQAQLARIDLEIQETEQQVAEAKATLDAELAKPVEALSGLGPDALTEQMELLKSAQADYARKAKHLKLLSEAREKMAGTHGKIER